MVEENQAIKFSFARLESPKSIISRPFFEVLLLDLPPFLL